MGKTKSYYIDGNHLTESLFPRKVTILCYDKFKCRKKSWASMHRVHQSICVSCNKLLAQCNIVCQISSFAQLLCDTEVSYCIWHKSKMTTINNYSNNIIVYSMKIVFCARVHTTQQGLCRSIEYLFNFIHVLQIT